MNEVKNIYEFNSVEEYFGWRIKKDILSNYGIKSLNYPSVEKANEEYTNEEKNDNHNIKSLCWHETDVLYSFLLTYYLGLKVVNKTKFEELVKEEKKTNKRLQTYSANFLLKCSRNKEFDVLNNSPELLEFLKLYYSIGNVIPMWPGGNEARGKKRIYDLPELFFNMYPYWTEKLMEKYKNAYLDPVVKNDIFWVTRKTEKGKNNKEYKNIYKSIDDFNSQILSDERAYFDQIVRRNTIIKLRQKKLLAEIFGNS